MLYQCLNVKFGGFHSSIILSLNGGIPRPIGYFPESSNAAASAKEDKHGNRDILYTTTSWKQFLRLQMC